MKFYQETKRVGELLGPIDWSYDFRSHFNNHCTTDERRDECCKESVEKLRQLAENPDQWQATTYGGWPRCGWGDIVAVGMYDGWPYWKPTPSVAIGGPFGAEWSSFSNVTSIRKK